MKIFKYIEFIRESVTHKSYIPSYEEAVEMAKGCPILAVGGTVEVRDIIAM